MRPQTERLIRPTEPARPRGPAWIWHSWKELHADVLGDPYVLDWRPLVVLVVTAVVLTLQEFLGTRGMFQKLFKAHAREYREHWELLSFVWWTGGRVLGYLVIPVVVVALLPGERLREYGWSTKGFFQHLKLYLLLFAIILPLVWLMSTTKPFQRLYPFYRLANRSAFDFWAWEAMYALQFLSLEFFFRGFMLHGLKKSLGAHSIWVMAVPYCMIHFGKTLQETLGAIVAGLVLGTVSLRTKSIWGGVLIHIAVALTMDWLCVRHCPAVGACPK